MKRYVIDTNVPVTAANGNSDATLMCQRNSLVLIKQVVKDGVVCLDAGNEIRKEYRNRLSRIAKDDICAMFYRQVVVNFNSSRVETHQIKKLPSGEYEGVPGDIIKSEFDKDDRKFIAVAVCARATIYNSTDSDWLIHKKVIRTSGVKLEFVCGCDESKWFEHGRKKS